MTQETPSPPEPVPPELVRAALSGNLVVFVGAGASHGRVPLWGDLLRSLLDDAKALLPATRTNAPRSLDPEGPVILGARLAEMDEATDWFVKDGDELNKASFLREVIGEHALRAAVARRTAAKDGDPTSTHHALAALEGTIFVTTNYDDLLERAIASRTGKRPRVVLPTDAEGLRDLAPGDVLKLHGDAANLSSIVLSHEEYFALHYMERTAWKKRLETLLQPPRRMLLLGYGYGDFDFRDVIDGLRAAYGNKLPGPFWLEVPSVQKTTHARGAGLALWPIAGYSEVPDRVLALAEAIRREREQEPAVVRAGALTALVLDQFEKRGQEAEAFFQARDYAKALHAFEQIVTDARTLLDTAPRDETLKTQLASAQLSAAACLVNEGRGLDARALVLRVSHELPGVLPAHGRLLLAELLGQFGDVPAARAALPAEENFPEKARSLFHVRLLLDILAGQNIDLPDDAPPSLRITRARVLHRAGRLREAADLAVRVVHDEPEDALLTLHALTVLIRALRDTCMERVIVDSMPGELSAERPVIDPIPAVLSVRESTVDQIEVALARLRRLPPPPGWQKSLLGMRVFWAQLTDDRHELEIAEKELQARPSNERAAGPLFTRPPVYQEAEELALAGKIDEAVALLPAMEPEWGQVIERARLFERAHRLDQALAEAEAMASRFPGKMPIEALLALVLHEQDRVEEALPHARAAFEALPARGHRLRYGQILYRAGHHANAWEVLAPLDSEGRPAEDPAILRALAVVAEQERRAAAEHFWRRYLAAYPDGAKDAALVRLRIAVHAYQLGEHDRVSDLAWDAWKGPGNQALDAKAIYEIAQLQAIGAEGPLTEERRNRIRTLERALAEQFLGQPEAEQYRWVLLHTIGEETSSRQIDFAAMETAGLIERLPIDHAAELFYRMRELQSTAYHWYTRGHLSFEGLCAAMDEPATLVFKTLESDTIHGSRFSAPLALLRPTRLDLREKHLFAGHIEVLLLDHLQLFSRLREALGPEGKLVLFRDVHERVLRDASELMLRQASTAASPFAEERDEHILKDAHQQAMRLQRALGAGVAEGWILLRPRPDAPDLPPLRVTDPPAAARFARDALAGKLGALRAIDEDPAGLLLVADHFMAARFAAHILVLPLLTWASPEAAQNLATRIEERGERMLSLADLVRQSLPERDRFHTLVSLVRLGFSDACDAETLLSMLEQQRRLVTPEIEQLLTWVEFAARTRDHAGHAPAQIHVAWLYARVIWDAACGEARWGDAVAHALCITLAARTEEIDTQTSGATLDTLFVSLATHAMGDVRASLVDIAPGIGELSDEAPAARLWRALANWAGSDGPRRASLERALQVATVKLVETYGDRAPPNRMCLGLLGAALNRSMETVLNEGHRDDLLRGPLAALAILSGLWAREHRPLDVLQASVTDDGTVKRGLETLLSEGAQALAPSDGWKLEEDSTTVAVQVRELDGHLPVSAPSEAWLLRASPEVIRDAALHLAELQGPDDGRAHERLMELSRNPGDERARRTVALGAAVAPFRLIRRDPTWLLAWTARGDTAHPRSLRELCAMLSEPASPLEREESPLSMLQRRVSTGGDWAADRRQDQWALLDQASELPGPLSAVMLLSNRLALSENDYAESVQAYLWVLDHAEEQSAGRISRAIVFLRAAAARRPRVARQDEGLDLRSALPERLATLVRKMGGVDHEAVRSRGPTLGTLEGGLLRQCSAVVTTLAGRRDVSDRARLWLTYRLYQWYCAQLDRITPDVRAAALQALAGRLPAAQRDIDVQDALDPFLFDRDDDERGFDHRLATVLYAVAMGEDLLSSLPSGDRRETLLSVTSPALEDALAQVASRSVGRVEAHLRALGDRPSKLGWQGPIAVPDLALFALLALRREAFFDLAPPLRLRWLLDLPASQEERTRAPSRLAARIVDAVLRAAVRLSREERRVVEAWARRLDGPQESLAPHWRRRVICALFGAGEAHLGKESRALLEASLTAPDAVDAFADHLLGSSRIDPARIGVEADAVLAAAQAKGVDPVGFFPALGRVLLVSQSPAAVDASAQALRALAQRASFREDARVLTLIRQLHLQ